MKKFYTYCAMAVTACALPLISDAQTFEELPAGLTAQYEGRIQWVDLDTDGDLDLMYSGFADGANEYHTLVYENNAGTFTARPTGLPDLRNGELAWGDYDKDGDPDILLSGLTSSGNTSALYENAGAFAFTLKASFPGILNSTLSWFDIDNDNDLDFLIAGVDDNTGTSDPFINKMFVYRNDGATFTLLSNTNLPPCSQCAMDWADVNTDGFVDVVITNVSKSSVSHTELYLNQHNSTFLPDEAQSLPQLSNGDVQWGDFDRDGDMDLLLSGARADGTITTDVYENRGGKLEWRDEITLYYVGENWHKGTRWVDYNNDGLLDIVVSGRGTSIIEAEYILKFFTNLGDGNFEEENMNVEGLAQSSLDFGDFDNDGDVDLAYMGLVEGGVKTGILKNQLINGAYVLNTKPAAPALAGMKEKFARKQIRLNWTNGSDAQTPTDAQSYNFYLKRGAVNSFVPGANLSTGNLMTELPSNGHAQTVLLDNLAEGNYTWAVQSIDGSKAASPFSAVKAFYQLHGPEAVKAEIVDAQHVKLTWIDNSGLETSYRVERSTDSLSGFASRGTVAANVTTYTDNFAFLPETYYYYRLFAVNATKSSGYDSLKVLVPATPENLVATETHAERIGITWDDMSDHETGYEIERRLASAATFEIVGKLAEDPYNFTDKSLVEGTEYVYRVRASNAYGYGAYSASTTIKTNFRPQGADIAKVGVEDTNVIFTDQEFADKFTDQDVDDIFQAIYVAALPARGTLKVGTMPVSEGQRIVRTALSNLAYSPAKDDNGLQTFSFYYDDGRDSSNVAYKVNIDLTPINDAPLFKIPTKITLDEDFEAMTIQPEIAIPNDEQSQKITWTLTPTEVTGIKAEFDNTNGALTLSPVADASGSWTFTVTADDGETENHTYAATVEVVVNSVNDAPRIDFIDDIAVEKADPVPSVTLVVADPDSPLQSISFGVTSDNQAVIKDRNIQINGMILSMTPELKVGKAVITVRATDGISIGTRSFTLEILTITAVEKRATGVDVYPNPVEQWLNVSVAENLTPPFRIVIRDALGRTVVDKVIESHQAQVDFGDLRKGMYLMKILTPGNDILYQGKISHK